jgi:hypothetical protein
LERRQLRRKKTVLPVKVSVADTSQFAHTLDITASGVRLDSLRSELKQGETIVLRRGIAESKIYNLLGQTIET